MPLATETTHFSRDVLGRYLCNTLFEAQVSADPNARPDADPPRGPRPDARSFDVVVVGGGRLAPPLPNTCTNRDSSKPEGERHRILVLEAGLVASAEHVQNLPLLGLNPPGPTRIADLRAAGQDQKPRAEVWGLAWHSATPFPGLAYCIGGRSIFFGGWSPRLLDAEMPQVPDPQHPFPWPAAMVQDLRTKYFDEAAAQIGTDTANDFISGPMHFALRQRLFRGHHCEQRFGRHSPGRTAAPSPAPRRRDIVRGDIVQAGSPVGCPDCDAPGILSFQQIQLRSVCSPRPSVRRRTSPKATT